VLAHPESLLKETVMARRIVPQSWMPACEMKRVILHWTAGGHHASASDREHYHILIEADGRLVRGDHAISDNVATGDNDYAAHTKGANTKSIGVSLCCMLNAMQHPFKPGPFPMTRAQWETMALVTADLCEAYGIPVAHSTVLGHGEVSEHLGKPQSGKWDPMVLPWDPSISGAQVGNVFRERVRVALDGGSPPPEAPPEQLSPITIIVAGDKLTDEGVLKGGTSWCPLRVLADEMEWRIVEIDADSTLVRTPQGDHELVAMIRGERGYVQIRDLCSKLGWGEPEWDPKTREVRLRGS
jgi:hypothetical protein